jgi:hypothetical protein
MILSEANHEAHLHRSLEGKCMASSDDLNVDVLCVCFYVGQVWWSASPVMCPRAWARPCSTSSRCVRSTKSFIIFKASRSSQSFSATPKEPYPCATVASSLASSYVLYLVHGRPSWPRRACPCRPARASRWARASLAHCSQVRHSTNHLPRENAIRFGRENGIRLGRADRRYSTGLQKPSGCHYPRHEVMKRPFLVLCVCVQARRTTTSSTWTRTGARGPRPTAAAASRQVEQTTRRT